MAPSAAIDIPIVHQDTQDQIEVDSSFNSVVDDVFSPLDSLSTSVSSISIADNYFEEQSRGAADLRVKELDLELEAEKYLQAVEEDPLLADCTQDAVTFGQGPDAWLYHPKSGVFDLTRRSNEKVHFPSHTDNMTGLLVDPNRTILVIVDMQNFFINPDCYPHKAGLGAVNPLLRVMEKCRNLGIEVSFLNWVIDEQDMIAMPPAVQRGWSSDRLLSHGVGWNVNLGSELPNGQGRCLWKGSWNAELYSPIKDAARTDDAVFFKNRPSGMWSRDCDMARYLSENNLKTVMFAGVNTDQCVLGTLTDCYSKSYDCIMIRDCVGTATTGLMAQELVEYNVERNYGFVLDSGCVLQARVLCT
ncbi:Peroxyureidoacrylate/ureidoacrylate amidohydrolase RutB [Cyphellophora attinorum]|uniref:Peroxyureidoacrylate/ureidoacrylate amidohydrolase RutB n=1 Tax=Cyphellophora attinorum TaxID=1664694 RepID=A0A0N1HM21_9EURO|nr:Peroxyureidoacrylate/ureidoacrylate amidohydrolase RutB [Phialophora attinorum]KPI38200.1 Peroxyureidoacrylate/ureidoacrylate amidohydrolase RutB [Phialophora attinorum]